MFYIILCFSMFLNKFYSLCIEFNPIQHFFFFSNFFISRTVFLYKTILRIIFMSIDGKNIALLEHSESFQRYRIDPLFMNFLNLK